MPDQSDASLVSEELSQLMKSASDHDLNKFLQNLVDGGVSFSSGTDALQRAIYVLDLVLKLNMDDDVAKRLKSIIQDLTSSGASLEVVYCGMPLIHAAVWMGNKWLVSWLCGSGVRLDSTLANGSTPLCVAMEKVLSDDTFDKSVVTVLIESGASIESVRAGGQRPIHFAANKGSVWLVKYLCSQGVDVNAKMDDGETALHHACKFRHFQVVKVLLENGAGVQMPRADGKTPFLSMVAEMRNDESEYPGFEKTADLLLEGGADINGRCDEGNTALYYCAAMFPKVPGAVEYLCSKGAEVSAVVEGRTALHYACFLCNGQAVKILIENGADVNVPSSDGITPLTQPLFNSACSFPEFRETIDLLVNGGADIDASSVHGLTALDLAAGKGNLPLVKHLVQAGADVNLNDQSAIIKAVCQMLRDEPLGAPKDYAEIVHALLVHMSNEGVEVVSSSLYEKLESVVSQGGANSAAAKDVLKMFRFCPIWRRNKHLFIIRSRGRVELPPPPKSKPRTRSVVQEEKELAKMKVVQFLTEAPDDIFRRIVSFL